MSTSFDESKIRRQSAGTSGGGQFAAKQNSAPSGSLSAAPTTEESRDERRRAFEINLRRELLAQWIFEAARKEYEQAQVRTMVEAVRMDSPDAQALLFNAEEYNHDTGTISPYGWIDSDGAERSFFEEGKYEPSVEMPYEHLAEHFTDHPDAPYDDTQRVLSFEKFPFQPHDEWDEAKLAAEEHIVELTKYDAVSRASLQGVMERYEDEDTEFFEKMRSLDQADLEHINDMSSRHLDRVGDIVWGND